MDPPISLSQASTQVEAKPQAAAFHSALINHKKRLTVKECQEYEITTLQDVKVTIELIQQQQYAKRRMQNLQRLKGFLEGMKEYDRVVQIFVNTSPILAFIWGPMKFLLQVACTWSDAFDTLIDAYQRIGEQLPLFSNYEKYFENEWNMAKILVLVYEDILAFQWKASRFFKHKMWKQLFHSLWRTFNTEFDNILLNLKEHRSLIESQASITHYAETMRVRQITEATLRKAELAETERRREMLSQWLFPARYEVDQQTCEKNRSKYPSSGRWLLEKDKFCSWLDSLHCANPLLWLSGIPGAGKTILASVVIEAAQRLQQNDQDTNVAYFYCRYGDDTRNTFLAVARAILSQLSHQSKALLEFCYEEASKSGLPKLTTESLAKELLRTAVRNSKRLYIILDGLDECDRDERKEIVSFFLDISTKLLEDDDNDVSLRCLFVSQEDKAARTDFEDVTNLRISSEDIKQDIRLYVRAWSLKIGEKFGLSNEYQQRIEDLILTRSDGMFLYAKLMSHYLHEQISISKLEEEMLSGKSLQGISGSEDRWPSNQVFLGAPTIEDLNCLYTRILTRMGGTNKLLYWLACARRPFKWRELQCAESIDLEEQTVDWERNRPCSEPKDIFGSLIEHQSDDSVILVHHTAKRYLINCKKGDIAAQEFALTLLCVGYLSFPGFDTSHDSMLARLSSNKGYYGFVDYAYAYWSRHLERSVSTSISEDEMLELTEALSVFIDAYWIEPETTIRVPPSYFERLQTLKDTRHFNKIATVVYMARKALLSSSTMPLEWNSTLKLDKEVRFIRSMIEVEASDTESWKTFEAMYGTDIYKCPRLDCTRFYNGFSKKQLRDDHVLKHDRCYFCSYSGCHSAILGFTTLRDLNEHERDYHKALEFDEYDDFPDMPQQKVAFNCTECDATFTRNHNLKIHMRKHTELNKKTFNCQTCGKVFARQGDRTRHESSSHSQSKLFTCGGKLKSGVEWGCGRSFNRADVLTRHYKSEKGRICRIPLEEEELTSMSSSPASDAQQSISQTSQSSNGTVT